MNRRALTSLFSLFLAVSFLPSPAQTSSIPPNSSPGPTPALSPATEAGDDLRLAFELMSAQHYEEALAQVNAAIQLTPQDRNPYILRGSIYSEMKRWDEAAQDFHKVLALAPGNAVAKFNLAEIDFRKKQYDAARPGFVALEKDRDLGELASYKVFLCDLLGGHEDVARKELDAFNRIGSGASYYFANAAWSLFHRQLADGRDWMRSAVNIFSPNKVNLYSSSLRDLGYLPIPSP